MTAIFKYGKEKIDIVRKLYLLGNSNFFIWKIHTLLIEHLREKAVHALFSWRPRIDFSSLKPSLFGKIFDRTTSPILTYNSKAWGVFINSGFLEHLPEKITYSFVNVI